MLSNTKRVEEFPGDKFYGVEVTLLDVLFQVHYSPKVDL